jgi:hypothetical protein
MVETEIMRRVFKFDNQLDNSVDAFNKLFNCRLPYNVSDDVEILEPYTTGGRYIKIGNREPEKFLFRRDFNGYETKTNWRAVYKFGKLLGIFKTSKQLEDESGYSQIACQYIMARNYVKQDEYLVLDLYE